MRDNVKNLLENNAITDAWLSSESMRLTLTDGSVIEVKARDTRWLIYKIWPSNGDKT